MGLLQPRDWQASWIGGRPGVDHDWTDLAVSFDFTLRAGSLSFLFRARPVGKTYGESYEWLVTSLDGRPTLIEQVRRYPGGSSSDTTLTVLKQVPIPGLGLATWPASGIGS